MGKLRAKEGNEPWARRRRRWSTAAGWGWVVLDVALLVVVTAVAADLRWTVLPAAPVLLDQASHLRSGAEILAGVPVAQPPYFYTSLYLLLMAAVQWATDGPLQALQVWATVGALGSGLLAVAIRRLAGPVAAVLGAEILCWQPFELYVQSGVKSPYFITVFSALAMLGLAGMVQRRWWGPPLLALGASAAVAMHFGVWPLGVAGVVLAFLGALFSGGNRWRRVLATAAPTTALTAWLWSWDGARIQQEVRFILNATAPPAQAVNPLPSILTQATSTVAAEREQLAMVLVACVIGSIGFALLGRTPLRDRLSSPTQRRAAVAALAATVLLALAPLHLVKIFRFNGALEPHHLVVLLPLALAGLAWWGSNLLPARPLPLSWLSAAAVLVPLWQAVHREFANEVPGRLRAPPQPSLLDLATLADVVHQDAKAHGKRPAIVALTPRAQPQRGILMVSVLDAFAVANLPWSDRPDRCWLLASQTTIGDQATARAGSLALRLDPDCTELPDQIAARCSATDTDLLPVRATPAGWRERWDSAAWFPCAPKSEHELRERGLAR